MNQEEIIALIKKGESEATEFKENFDDDTIETAGAFANTRGGTIIIGVSDNGQIKGIQIGKETISKWANQVSQSTDPRVIPEIEPVEVNGKSVAAIMIRENPIKPVSVRGRCYRRVGTSNRVMTPQEIAEMHLASTGTSWDKCPAKDYAITDIDIEKVRRFMRRANDTGRKTIKEDEDPMQVLGKLELLKDGKPTWAAVLLFGDEKKRSARSSIHCGRFKEETTVIDDRMIQSSVIEQVDEAMDFIRKNTNVKFVMTGRPERDEVWDYPLDAIREALINAICHRDYTIASNTEVRIHDDSLTIWNPGGLPVGITLDDLYKPHKSVLRNKGIGEAFYDMGWIERWGSGIEKMKDACARAGLPEPKLEEYQHGFQVAFRKDIYAKEYLLSIGLNERQIKAVMHVKERKSINVSSFGKIAPDCSFKTLYRDLQDLVKKGVLKEVGEKRGRRYELA